MTSLNNLQCDDASTGLLNNNIFQKKKCKKVEPNDHEQKLLELICYQCDEKICMLCYFSEHKDHNVHPIKSELKSNLEPFINIHSYCNNLVESKNEEYNKLISDEYESNIEMIENHYEKILENVKNEKLTKLKELKILYNQHKTNYEENKIILKNEKNILDNALKSKDNLNSNDAVIKIYNKLEKTVSKGNNNSKLLLKNNRIDIVFGKRYNSKDSNKNCNIKPQPPLSSSLNDNSWLENCLYINKNNKNNPIPDTKDHNSIALAPEVDIELLTIPSNIKHVLLLDGYNVNLKHGSIKNNANYSLHLFNIKTILTKDSIPSSIKALYLHDGFSQSIESFIDQNVSELHLYGIKCQLTSIPACVGTVHFHKGFNQIINPDCLGDKLLHLHLYGINENTLINGSIPITVYEVNLHDGFNLELIKGIIPSGVQIVKLYNILKPLKAGSIPIKVTNLHLKDGFNQTIEKGVLPNTIENVYVENIQKPFIEGSLPNSIKLMHFNDNFNQIIGINTIPNSVETLLFGDIQNNLVVGSIPNSVSKIYLNRFSAHLTSGLLPNNLNYLEICNIKHELTNNSIPESVETMVLNNYNHELKPDHLPKKLTKLSLYNLKKPLEIGSIPNSVTDLQIGAMDDLSLVKGILNEGLISLKFIEMKSLKSISKDSIPNSVKSITAPKSLESTLSPILKTLKKITVEYK